MLKKCAIFIVATVATLGVQAATITITVDPVDYPSGTVLNTIVPQFTLNTADQNNTIELLPTVEADTPTSGEFAGIGVFSHGVDFWNDNKRLRIDFNGPTTAIQIEVISNSSSTPGIGTLDVYDSSGVLLGQETTSSLNDGQSAIVALSGLPSEAAYAVATANSGSFSRFTDLEVTQLVPEPTAAVLLLVGTGIAIPRRRSRGASLSFRS